jgi:hypothetical protein
MHNSVRGEMHYMAADLDSPAWIEAGYVRLEDYLACWSLFKELFPSDPR